MDTAASLSVKQLIICPVCHHRMRDPRTMPCLHSFCRDCLQHCIDNRHLGNDWDYHACRVPCPVCRKVADLPKGGAKCFPTSDRLKSLCRKFSRTLDANNNVGDSSPSLKSACGSQSEMSDSGVSFSCDVSSCRESTDDDDADNSSFRGSLSSRVTHEQTVKQQHKHHVRRASTSHYCETRNENSAHNSSASSLEESTDRLTVAAGNSVFRKRHRSALSGGGSTQRSVEIGSDKRTSSSVKAHKTSAHSETKLQRITTQISDNRSLLKAVDCKNESTNQLMQISTSRIGTRNNIPKPIHSADDSVNQMLLTSYIRHVPQRSEKTSAITKCEHNSDNRSTATSTKGHVTKYSNDEIVGHLLHPSGSFPQHGRCQNGLELFAKDSATTQCIRVADASHETDASLWSYRIQDNKSTSALNRAKSSCWENERLEKMQKPLDKKKKNTIPASTSTEDNSSASFVSTVQVHLKPTHHYECNVIGKTGHSYDQQKMSSSMNKSDRFYADTAHNKAMECDDKDASFKDELLEQIARMRIKQEQLMERDVQLQPENGEQRTSKINDQHSVKSGVHLLVRSKFENINSTQNVTTSKTGAQHQTSQKVSKKQGLQPIYAAVSGQHRSTLAGQQSTEECSDQQENHGGGMASEVLQTVKGFVHNLSRQYSLLAAKSVSKHDTDVMQRQKDEEVNITQTADMATLACGDDYTATTEVEGEIWATSGHVHHLSRQYSSMAAKAAAAATAAALIERQEAQIATQCKNANTQAERCNGNVRVGTAQAESNFYSVYDTDTKDESLIMRDQLEKGLRRRRIHLHPESPETDNELNLEHSLTVQYGVSNTAEYLVLGQYGHDLFDLTNPVGLVVMPCGSVVVSDQRGRRIIIFDSAGRVKTMFICAREVGNIALTNSTLLVAVRGCAALAYEFQHDGHLLRDDIGEEFGEAGAYGLSVTYKDNRRIIVASSPETDLLYVLSGDHYYVLECSRLLRRPAWVALTPDGDSVWVSDEDCLRKFNMSGDLQVEIGRGSGRDELLQPAAICLDDDHLIVADSGNRRVQRYAHDGQFIDTFVTLPLWPVNVALGDGKLAVLMVGARAEVRLYPYTRVSS